MYHKKLLFDNKPNIGHYIVVCGIVQPPSKSKSHSAKKVKDVATFTSKGEQWCALPKGDGSLKHMSVNVLVKIQG